MADIEESSRGMVSARMEIEERNNYSEKPYMICTILILT